MKKKSLKDILDPVEKNLRDTNLTSIRKNFSHIFRQIPMEKNVNCSSIRYYLSMKTITRAGEC